MSKVLAWTAPAATLLSPAVLIAVSATYPDRPIRFIVPRREIDKWGKVVRATKLTVH